MCIEPKRGWDRKYDLVPNKRCITLNMQFKNRLGDKKWGPARWTGKFHLGDISERSSILLVLMIAAVKYNSYNELFALDRNKFECLNSGAKLYVKVSDITTWRWRAKSMESCIVCGTRKIFHLYDTKCCFNKFSCGAIFVPRYGVFCSAMLERETKKAVYITGLKDKVILHTFSDDCFVKELQVACNSDIEVSLCWSKQYFAHMAQHE